MPARTYRAQRPDVLLVMQKEKTKQLPAAVTAVATTTLAAAANPLARAPSGFWGPAAARARSRAACGGGERARRSESTYAQLVDMISRIVAHNRLLDGSFANATCARGTDQAKLNAWWGKS